MNQERQISFHCRAQIRKYLDVDVKTNPSLGSPAMKRNAHVHASGALTAIVDNLMEQKMTMQCEKIRNYGMCGRVRQRTFLPPGGRDGERLDNNSGFALLKIPTSWLGSENKLSLICVSVQLGGERD